MGLATDNDLLRSLGEVGILGTIVFVFIIYILIRNYLGELKKAKGFMKYLTVGMISMVFAFLVNSLFIDVFEASKVAFMFWLVNGLGLGYLIKEKYA